MLSKMTLLDLIGSKTVGFLSSFFLCLQEKSEESSTTPDPTVPLTCVDMQVNPAQPRAGRIVFARAVAMALPLPLLTFVGAAIRIPVGTLSVELA